MLSIKITVTCDNCNSTDVTTEEKECNPRVHVVKKAEASDNTYQSLKLVDKKLLCHCNNCGEDFEEDLCSEIVDMLPVEIEVE